MNERIKEFARQAGATDEQGNRAENVFCFTATELSGFTDLIVRECCKIVNVNGSNLEAEIVADIKEQFGVE